MRICSFMSNCNNCISKCCTSFVEILKIKVLLPTDIYKPNLPVPKLVYFYALCLQRKLHLLIISASTSKLTKSQIQWIILLELQIFTTILMSTKWPRNSFLASIKPPNSCLMAGISKKK